MTNHFLMLRVFVEKYDFLSNSIDLDIASIFFSM